jgi:glycosyltransferase involved in cell wall biosynthesis
MIRILFLISSLNRGGAERQLLLLVKGLDRRRFAVTVVTVYDGGSLRPDLEDIAGVHYVSLHKQGRGDYLRPLWRLARIIRQQRPHAIHGYMGIANILALLFGKFFGAKVIWGLRASNIDFAHYDRLSAWYFRFAAELSRFPDLIIANSYTGKSYHVAEGYSSQRMIVIPNGFDTETFRPDRALGSHVRAGWGVPDDAVLIGLVARVDPMKDHATFLKAAALLASEFEHVCFVCVGNGLPAYRQQLEELGTSLGLGDRLIWAGERGDMPAVQNALDIATSSTAFGEGFSNTIGEAMACGVPCVVTDVGDSARLVGATGLTIPFGDSSALAAAWRTIVTTPPMQLAAQDKEARARIVREFNQETLARRTERAFSSLLP